MTSDTFCIGRRSRQPLPASRLSGLGCSWFLIPFALAEMQAGFLELFPNPPLTRDQVRLLKTDKVVSGAEPTLGDLGVQPRPLEEFLPVFKEKYG